MHYSKLAADFGTHLSAIISKSLQNQICIHQNVSCVCVIVS